MNINQDECWMCKRKKEEFEKINFYFSNLRITWNPKDIWIPLCPICGEVIALLSGKYEE